MIYPPSSGPDSECIHGQHLYCERCERLELIERMDSGELVDMVAAGNGADVPVPKLLVALCQEAKEQREAIEWLRGLEEPK